mgnify:CR=1 FL=1
MSTSAEHTDVAWDLETLVHGEGADGVRASVEASIADQIGRRNLLFVAAGLIALFRGVNLQRFIAMGTLAVLTVIAAGNDVPVQQARTARAQAVAATGFSRFPLVADRAAADEGEEPAITGYLHLKDILYADGADRTEPFLVVTDARRREVYVSAFAPGPGGALRTLAGPPSFASCTRDVYDEGLYCRADDRGDPVIQLSPPLVCTQEHFDEMEQILRAVLEKAWAQL